MTIAPLGNDDVAKEDGEREPPRHARGYSLESSKTFLESSDIEPYRDGGGDGGGGGGGAKWCSEEKERIYKR